MSPADVGHGAVIELSRRERTTRFRFGKTDWAPKPAVDVASRLFEAATRRAAPRLSSYLGATVMCSPGDTQQVPFEQHAATLESPAFLACLRARTETGPPVLGFSPELVSSLLGAMLGAAGDARASAQHLTDIERHVLGAVVQIMSEELRQAWNPHAGCGFEPESVEAEAEACRIRSDALVVVMRASCSFGGKTGRMDLVLPSAFVRATASRPGRRQASDCPVRADALRLARSCQVRAEVRLQGARVLARDLLQLKPGQVLRLPHPAGRALSLAVNGKPKFKGQVVTGENTLGFQIEQVDEEPR